MPRSSLLIDPDLRERQVATLFAEWPTDLAGVLVGGYAVAAYGRPRYSVDVDIVAPMADRLEWEGWLKSHRLVRQKTHRVAGPDGRPVEVERWQRRAVSLDLMTGGVRDRDSHATIPEEWVLRDPIPIWLELLSGRVEHPVKVVRTEGLWAMKILAGRPQDLTDLFGIMAQPVNLREVRELFGTLMQPALRNKLDWIVSEAGNKNAIGCKVHGPKFHMGFKEKPVLV